MNNETKTYLDSSEFIYPSAEEIKTILQGYPNLKNFGFKLPKDILELLSDNADPYDVKRRNNLYWWDTCLLNKLGKLRHAYINAIAQCNRGLLGENMMKVEKAAALRFQFNYHIEVAYYHYFSSRDVILQIMNLYLKEPLEENKLFGDRMQKAFEPDAWSIIEQFQIDIRDTSEIRNAFTHRYPPNIADHRSRIEHDGDKLLYLGGDGRAISPPDIVNNMNHSLARLARLISDVGKYMQI